MSESSQYAAITSTSASDTASPPGLPQYSGGVGVLSASTVSKSSPQYATASTVSITVPPGRPQYSSVGGQPALYSAVAGQSVTQNFSSQPFQPTSIGMIICNLTRALLTICSEKEFYLLYLIVHGITLWWKR